MASKQWPQFQWNMNFFAKDMIKCKYMQKKAFTKRIRVEKWNSKALFSKEEWGWWGLKKIQKCQGFKSSLLQNTPFKKRKIHQIPFTFRLQSWFIKFPMYSKTMFCVNPLRADFTLVRFVKNQNISLSAFFIQMSFTLVFFGIFNLLKYDLWPHIVQLSGKKVCTKRGLAILVLYIYLRRCGFGPFSSFFIELHSVDAATSIVFNIFERSSRTFELQGTSAWIWNNLKHKIK